MVDISEISEIIAEYDAIFSAAEERREVRRAEARKGRAQSADSSERSEPSNETS